MDSNRRAAAPSAPPAHSYREGGALGRCPGRDVARPPSGLRVGGRDRRHAGAVPSTLLRPCTTRWRVPRGGQAGARKGEAPTVVAVRASAGLCSGRATLAGSPAASWDVPRCGIRVSGNVLRPSRPRLPQLVGRALSWFLGGENRGRPTLKCPVHHRPPSADVRRPTRRHLGGRGSSLSRGGEQPTRRAPRGEFFSNSGGTRGRLRLRIDLGPNDAPAKSPGQRASSTLHGRLARPLGPRTRGADALTPAAPSPRSPSRWARALRCCEA